MVSRIVFTHRVLQPTRIVELGIATYTEFYLFIDEAQVEVIVRNAGQSSFLS